MSSPLQKDAPLKNITNKGKEPLLGLLLCTQVASAAGTDSERGGREADLSRELNCNTYSSLA